MDYVVVRSCMYSLQSIRPYNNRVYWVPDRSGQKENGKANELPRKGLEISEVLTI